MKVSLRKIVRLIPQALGRVLRIVQTHVENHCPLRRRQVDQSSYITHSIFGLAELVKNKKKNY